MNNNRASYFNWKEEETCLARARPLGRSSAMTASQMRWPLKKKVAPYCREWRRSTVEQVSKKMWWSEVGSVGYGDLYSV